MVVFFFFGLWLCDFAICVRLRDWPFEARLLVLIHKGESFGAQTVLEHLVKQEFEFLVKLQGLILRTSEFKEGKASQKLQKLKVAEAF